MSWQPFSYKGFDLPSITNSTPLSSLPLFKDCKNTLLVGGSNITESSPLLQRFNPAKSNFDIFAENVELVSKRSGTVLGMMGEDNIVVFGGTE